MNETLQTMYRLTILLAALMFYSAFDAEAQRRGATTYESLLQRTDQPSAYIDHVVIPAGDGSAQVAITFRLDYDFIPFLRIRQGMSTPSADTEYYAPIRMGVEIFEGAAPGSSRRASSATSVFRDTWQDTVWVDSFEATKSRFDYVQGYVPATLQEGQYHYELQLARAGSVREQASSRRTFQIHDYDEAKNAEFIILSDYELSGNSLNAQLLNYGNNVLYGQDYSVLIRLPKEELLETDQLTLNLHRMPSGESSSVGEVRHTEEISNDQIIHFNSVSFSKSNGELTFSTELQDEGVRYAHVTIPNQDFENARYRLRLMAEGQEDPVGERTINSQWLDMPVSLYNLDVAIDMLRFIVSDSELRRLNSGSSSDRERKFREFWTERDPTPDTEYNELMAEYYRRIDYAYQNFTSLQTPGYQTDQGRAYIVYGPPTNVERRLPANAPTREIWEYPNRTLIFEATTGFGDFRLVSESS
jgi:GWxTD domain-containing protein